MDFKNYQEHSVMYTPYLDRLAALFRKMDDGYDNTAAQYGFTCNGCSDSCCRTRFYHHTQLEYYYLLSGLDSLDPNDRRAIHARACQVNSQWQKQRESSPATLCPLNEADRCRLYVYRPMICRLHGIPHELIHPIKGRSVSPGCHEFVVQYGKHPYVAFDRTPLYRELADLEKSFRQETGFGIKIRMTVAEMLVASQNERYDLLHEA